MSKYTVECPVCKNIGGMMHEVCNVCGDMACEWCIEDVYGDWYCDTCDVRVCDVCMEDSCDYDIIDGEEGLMRCTHH